MSLEVNKIAAAGLTAGVVAMLAGFAADLLVHSPSLEQDAYPIVVASSGGEGEAEPAPSGPESVLPLLAQADPANGERLVRACQACHSFDKNGANKVGPNLYAVVGAELGHLEDFAYSNAMVERREAGDTWTYENLNHFLENPRDWLPGTKMAYAGMGKVESRADVIAYLRGQADAEAPLPSQEEIEAVQPEGEAAEAEVLPAAGSESADAGEEQAAPAAADDQQAAAPAAEGGEQTAAEGGEQTAAAGGEGPLALIAAADPAEGAKAARKCAACHSFEEGGANKIGPNLYDVVGAEVAHREDYNYSTAFQEAKSAGETWSYDKLWTYLENPRAEIPGTKMTFAGLRKEEELAAVIAYLREQSASPPPLE